MVEIRESTIAGMAGMATNATGLIGAPFEIATSYWQVEAEENEAGYDIAKSSHTTPEALRHRSAAMRQLAETRADEYANRLLQVGGAAAGAAATTAIATAALGPLGLVGGLAVGGVGTVGGSMMAGSLITSQKEPLITFFMDTQKKIDNRQISGEQLFAHAVLSLPKDEMKRMVWHLQTVSEGAINNVGDMVSTFTEKPPNEKKLEALRFAMHDPEINASISSALGLHIGLQDMDPMNPAQMKVTAADKLAVLLNSRPESMPFIQVMTPDDIFPLTHNYNMYQSMHEEKYLAQMAAQHKDSYKIGDYQENPLVNHNLPKLPDGSKGKGVA